MDRIVFYDGVCGLCQRSVALMAKMDVRKELIFAPLNGETYKLHFNKSSDLTTVVFYSKGQLYTKSEAILEAVIVLGGWGRVAFVLKIIPRFIRDALYDFVARHRKKVSCIILPRDQRFLK